MASIKPKSFGLLDHIASVLRVNPQLTKVRVEIHADAQGDDTFHLKQSQERATRVCDTLVDEGAANERLLFEGYGKARPIAENQSRSSRTQNRRIEFVIVEHTE